MTSMAGRSRLGRALVRVVAWGVVPLYLIGMGGKIWMDHQLGLDTSLLDVMLAVGFGAFAVVGAVLVARRPQNLVSWIMVAIGLMTALFPAAETYAAFVMTKRGSPDPLAVFGVWANDVYFYPLMALALVYLPMVFPDGRLLSRRWRWVVLFVALSVVGAVVASAFRPTLVGQDIDYHINNPIGIAGAPSAFEGLLGDLLFAGLAIGLAGAVTSVIVRFRRSHNVERQQLKWFLYAVAFYPLLLFPNQVPVLGDIALGFVLILLPVAVGVAVLRYRLYDIDVVIRKTLVYSTLTVLLAFVYFGIVVLLQSLFGKLAGVEQSQLALVISTLAIAALFTPLRRRIQDFIDRRFFRKKYDAQQVLAQFALTVRDETDLDALTAELLRVVQETMQPEEVSVWLRKQEAPRGVLPASGLPERRS